MDVKKTKVESLDIIVTMMEDKPYYGIKYKEVSSDHFCIGYSSYRLDYVLEWKKQYFELVESEARTDAGVQQRSGRIRKNIMPGWQSIHRIGKPVRTSTVRHTRIIQ